MTKLINLLQTPTSVTERFTIHKKKKSFNNNKKGVSAAAGKWGGLRERRATRDHRLWSLGTNPRTLSQAAPRRGTCRACRPLRGLVARSILNDGHARLRRLSRVPRPDRLRSSFVLSMMRVSQVHVDPYPNRHTKLIRPLFSPL